MKNAVPLDFRKMHLILHRSYIESRNLALGKHYDQLYDLADCFELIPSYLPDLNAENLRRIRGLLESYQTKYPQTASNYLSILDMDEPTFDSLFAAWGPAAASMTTGAA